jgi:hypothetical protein
MMLKKLALAALLAWVCRAQTTVFQLHGTPAEVTSTSDGAIVTPAFGAPGLLVVSGTGSVAFDSGVAFKACCLGANNAFYRFTGAGLASLFSAAGSISFVLKSHHGYAERQGFGSTGFRYVFDVQDQAIAAGNQFGLSTKADANGIALSYWTGGGGTDYYYIPPADADTLFGNGISLAVGMSWDATSFTLSLNGAPVKTSVRKAPIYQWGASSSFLIGAQPYGGGGYNSCDDSIGEFTITYPAGTATPPVTPPSQVTCDPPVISTTSGNNLNVVSVSLTCTVNGKKMLNAFGYSF